MRCLKSSGAGESRRFPDPRKKETVIPNPRIKLADVQAVYSGAEGRLWQLLMGEQIHIGGLASSLDLAERAGIRESWRRIDLCSALGAGMRALLRFRNVAHMTGVDATRAMIDTARERCRADGVAERTAFIEANVCTTGLPSTSFDFAWGEDAWCYVEDKAALIAEATRLVRPGGRIAFTDWMVGGSGLAASESERYLSFMKFPGVMSLDDYRTLLESRGCAMLVAQDTGRFPGHVRLYLEMIDKQLTFDALRIIGFDMGMARALTEEMRFIQSLAEDGRILQGLIVAEKK